MCGRTKRPVKRGKRMRTLILNGSPRKNGDTAALVEAFCQELEGEVRMLTPDDGILPCSDCRRCKVLPGCSIQDKMQEAIGQESENSFVGNPLETGQVVVSEFPDYADRIE